MKEMLVAWTGLFLGAAAVLAMLAGLVSAVADLRRGHGMRLDEKDERERTLWRRACQALHPYRKLIAATLVVILVCACLYRFWAAKLNPKQDFLGCLYFSAATVTWVNFGDIRPSGPARFIALLEAGGGLLLLGMLVAKLATARTVAAVQASRDCFARAEFLGEADQFAVAVARLNRLCTKGAGPSAERRVDHCLYAIGASLNRKLRHLRQGAAKEGGYTVFLADVQAVRLYIDTITAALETGNKNGMTGDEAQRRILRDIHSLCRDILGTIRNHATEQLAEDGLLWHRLDAELAAAEKGLAAHAAVTK